MSRQHLGRPLGVVLVIALCAFVATAGATDYPSKNQYEVSRSGLAQDGEGYVESIDMLFNVVSGGALSLGTSTGSVRIRPWSQDKVRLVITKRTHATNINEARRMLEMFRIQALHGGKDLSLTARARTQECAKSVGVTYTIWVPRSYNLDIKTDKGSINIGEVEGKLVAHTGEGSISLDVDPEKVDIEVQDRTRGGAQDGEPASPGNTGGAAQSTNGPKQGAERGSNIP